MMFFLIVNQSNLTKAQNNATVSNKSHNESLNCETLKFHFIELDNYGWSTSTLKHLEIFLDEKAFSESNLKILFNFLSKKYKSEKQLTIVVHTNWQQLNLPTECSSRGLTNQLYDSDIYNYYQAVYYKKEKAEYFRYTPSLKTGEFKLVILKGDKSKFIIGDDKL